jgi:sulfonate transport system ATP-binding protein
LQRIWEQERITMILVTHDVDEALYLGDRVVTMAPRPGRIKRVVDVALPRPRERHDPRFVQLRDEVLADFAEHDGDRNDTPYGGTRIPVASPPITEWRLAW